MKLLFFLKGPTTTASGYTAEPRWPLLQSNYMYAWAIFSTGALGVRAATKSQSYELYKECNNVMGKFPISNIIWDDKGPNLIKFFNSADSLLY